MSDKLAAVRLDVRVMPRSPRTGLAGVRDGRLVVRVTAPPVEDAANQAVIQVLADALGIPRTSIRIVSGATSRNKTLEIQSVNPAALREFVARHSLDR